MPAGVPGDVRSGEDGVRDDHAVPARALGAQQRTVGTLHEAIEVVSWWRRPSLRTARSTASQWRRLYRRCVAGPQRDQHLRWRTSPVSQTTSAARRALLQRDLLGRTPHRRPLPRRHSLHPRTTTHLAGADAGEQRFCSGPAHIRSSSVNPLTRMATERPSRRRGLRGRESVRGRRRSCVVRSRSSVQHRRRVVRGRRP